MEAPEALSLARDALDAGHLVVIPTDTVYGIAARLDRPDCLQRLFDVKHRPKSKPLAILVPDLESARGLGRFNEEALRRAKQGWPGALTLVVPAASAMPELGGDGATIGLRMPDHEWTARLLRSTGPLAVTSANPSGSPTGVSVADVAGDLGDEVRLYVDGGRLDSAPSTVISLVGEPEVLR